MTTYALWMMDGKKSRICYFTPMGNTVEVTDMVEGEYDPDPEYATGIMTLADARKDWANLVARGWTRSA